MRLVTLVLVVLLAALVAWLFRRTARLAARLDESEARLARRLYRAQGRIGQLEGVVQELEFERRRARGEIRLDADRTLGEILAIHPRMREILGAYGLAGTAGGGCGPGAAPDESLPLREACGRRSLDPAAVLDALRRFVADPGTPPDVRPDEARLHRIVPLPTTRD